MHDHWWWRPGWAPGRRMVTAHLTFADDAAVCALADPYRRALAPLEIFDAVPDRWLHMTLQDIAFLDELEGRHIDEFVDALTEARSGSFDLAVHPAEVGTEGVFLPATPSAGLDALRSAVRASIAAIGLPVPGDEEGFWPHISVAYCHASAEPEQSLQAVAQVDAPAVQTHISRIDVIALSRDSHLYEWLPIAAIPLV